MERLVFSGNLSLDGYINDRDGNFDFAEPSEEIHQFWNDLDAGFQTHVYGRGLYESMAVWETMDTDIAVMAEYGANWRKHDKIVVSSTLESVWTPRTTLLRDPSGLAELLKDGDATIGGPTLAASVMHLITDVNVILYPVTIGSGTPFFPAVRANFELVESRVFETGAVHLHYTKEI